MSRCCICRREVTDENAPILTMSGYGNPRYVCSECEANIEKATHSRELDEIEGACKALGDALTAANTDELIIINSVNGIIGEAMERYEKIKAGDYDFSEDEDEDASSDEFEITEELMETEEDKRKDEQEARASQLVDKIISWSSAVILAGLVIYLLIRFIF